MLETYRQCSFFVAAVPVALEAMLLIHQDCCRAQFWDHSQPPHIKLAHECLAKSCDEVPSTVSSVVVTEARNAGDCGLVMLARA